ncbi:MAG: bifunctional DNA-binding transcriptional regulator/O6-methylguanine-DNA methyltransferase Ada [Candidatus Baltobacteraceae bacterium]
MNAKLPGAAIDDEYYEALVARDPAYEQRFVYGVKTTGVYCRPTCKSRRPLRRNVEVFSGTDAARNAGYRACKRCKPDNAAADERMLLACRHIEEAETPPTLLQLAAVLGMSEYHLQRRFTKEIGVSPRAYAKLVRERRLRAGLRNGESVTDAMYDAGFTSASQVYGNVPSTLGMSVNQFRTGGSGASIVYGIVESALGLLLVASTERGVCRVDIGDTTEELERRLHSDFPQAEINRADDHLESTTSLIVAYVSGKDVWPRLPVDVRASAFQARVWSALRDIAPGSTMSYGKLAEAIGSPTAARAVARACAANSIALLIPCHRIVPSGSGVGGYRWDPQRKQTLLQLERSTKTS